MAKKLVKCLYCGKTFDANSEPFVKPRSNRYAHADCAAAASANKSQEEKDKEELEKYILQLLGISYITPKIKKQIKDYREKYNYTYSGMRKSLVYFYEVQRHTTEKANEGIGIIPYIYRSAFDYYRAIWEAQQQNERVEQVVVPAREVHIKPPEREPINKLRRLFTFLDEGDD